MTQSHDPKRPFWPDKTAAVIGSGFAGMVAAAALARTFGTVWLIDRDAHPDKPALRKSVPQAAHVHALLHSGQTVLESLFPGFEREATAQGSLPLKVRSGWRSFSAGRWLPPVDTGVQVLSQTRPALDHLIKQQIAGNAVIRPLLARVTGLLSDATDPGAVTGLRLLQEGRERDLPADLVVDAGGRAEQGAQWLADLGYAPPPVETAYPEVRYVSGLFSRRITAGEDLAGWLNFASAPMTRGAVLAPVENGRWMATATCRFDTQAPATEAEFRAFLDALPDDKISSLLTGETLVRELKSYRIAAVRFNRFDQATRPLPKGYLPLGDRIATFNPLYGQGMSVAALQCQALSDVLGQVMKADPACDWRQALAAPYLARASLPAEAAWLIGQANDMEYPAYRGQPSEAAVALNRDLRRAFATSIGRPERMRRIDRVLHLLDPLSSLAAPDRRAPPSAREAAIADPGQTTPALT
ncbi:hypothetical protein [Phaeobacter gallaeciensis]|uniref:hypothetical protein n=1 Tax=Phaeobacter gallaeciensis TaxID=60890 RepID=UPI000BBBB3E3|nr:hypothetical protein [Phaeobacter gallaeciensis]ATF18569.1 Putative epoxidase LasC [Phaeobacter gallaeciensis]ATF22678.1 Putative epoxidase LasC [Phaeobacter gallaeciensis]